MRRISTRWSWGLALVLLGVGLLLSALNIPGARDGLAMWWPALLVVLAIGEFLSDDLMSGAFWIIIGGVLLLFTTRYISYSGNIRQIIWPIVLVLLGLRFLIRPARRPKIESHGCDWVGPSATFSETVEKETSQDFKGTSVRAVFGGAKLDLSDAKIAQEGAVIELTVRFGGVELSGAEGHAGEIGDRAGTWRAQ